ncbi:MAG: hypothetical protein IH946_04605 [Bacteroidetes bacterium]|nr:hypothetical protein [Bacteroidota bacterium]
MIGGNWYTPLNLEQSIADETSVFQEDTPLSVKGDIIFKGDLAVTYRRNRKKTTHEIKIEVLNFTNNQASLYEWYNGDTKEVEKGTQLPLFPNMSYRVSF